MTRTSIGFLETNHGLPGPVPKLLITETVTPSPSLRPQYLLSQLLRLNPVLGPQEVLVKRRAVYLVIQHFVQVVFLGVDVAQVMSLEHYTPLSLLICCRFSC